jgi:hypothetical protein
MKFKSFYDKAHGDADSAGDMVQSANDVAEDAKINYEAARAGRHARNPAFQTPTAFVRAHVSYDRHLLPSARGRSNKAALVKRALVIENSER